jgi:hypothetical protein
MTSVRILDGGGREGGGHEAVAGGTLAEGARARVVQPRLLPAVWRVTRYDPPRGFWWETSMPGMHILAGHRVEATPGGSRLTLEIDATGLLTPLFAALTQKMTMRYMAMEAAGVKRRAEERAGASPA